MSTRIFKFELTPSGRQEVIRCTAVLSVIEQDGRIMVYVTNDPNHLASHVFQVLGTGDDRDIAKGMAFIGTVKCGPFVWHVFCRREKEGDENG